MNGFSVQGVISTASDDIFMFATSLSVHALYIKACGGVQTFLNGQMVKDLNIYIVFSYLYYF